MNYRQHEKIRQLILSYFEERATRFPQVAEHIQGFFDQPSLTTARELMRFYFKSHQEGDVESLRMITWTFAEKSLVRDLLKSMIDDQDALAYVAQRSYPHPIGFDKLVLYEDPDTHFKLRLHIYWRGNQRVEMERLHLHKFEMASAIITGELTNHEWNITGTNLQPDLIPGIETAFSLGMEARESKSMYAYSGYYRDPEGALHKKFLGACSLERVAGETFVSGNSYAQPLRVGHYVETNAETGKSNGDICSTIYIHGPNLIDAAGRRMPILFEDAELSNPDQIINPIPPMTTDALRAALGRYRDFLDQNIAFYDWLFDPKHGRDLSVGMNAGYLLAESYGDPETISRWIDQEDSSKDILRECSRILGELVRGELTLANIPDENRHKRYYTMLFDKAQRHTGGPLKWLDQYGDLVKEMWRYCGAVKGEKPDVTMLKPVWEAVIGKRLPGGAHYGHVAAMIEAAYKANRIAAGRFHETHSVTYKGEEGPVCDEDRAIEDTILSTLREYYPAYSVFGEECGDHSSAAPRAGERRWLVDSIDGTANYLAGRPEYCVSMACQEYKDGAWETTDAVLSVPHSDAVYWAEKGKGAYIIERNDHERQLYIPQPVPPRDVLKRELVDLSVKGLGLESEVSLIQKLRVAGAVCRASGSAGIMLAMVADRGNGGAVITANEYDVAAGRLIAEEAGASVSTIDFSRRVSNGKQREFTALIAGKTAAIHDALRADVLAALSEAPAADMKLEPT